MYVLLYTYNQTHMKQGKRVKRRGKVDRAGGFRKRAEAPGTYAGVAGILPADQEGSDVASGCRRSGMVPTAGTRLPDEN